MSGNEFKETLWEHTNFISLLDVWDFKVSFTPQFLQPTIEIYGEAS